MQIWRQNMLWCIAPVSCLVKKVQRLQTNSLPSVKNKPAAKYCLAFFDRAFILHRPFRNAYMAGLAIRSRCEHSKTHCDAASVVARARALRAIEDANAQCHKRISCAHCLLRCDVGKLKARHLALKCVSSAPHKTCNPATVVVCVLKAALVLL